MKIIHTSDWHLGQNFYGYDRSEDHESMINQLIELVHAEEPDALVIAGDIFDVPTPNTAVQKSFAEVIVRIHDACPSMTIVCISGNHDSASRHEIHQTPWEALKVKMIGKANMTDMKDNIIPIGYPVHKRALPQQGVLQRSGSCRQGNNRRGSADNLCRPRRHHRMRPHRARPDERTFRRRHRIHRS